MAEPDAAPRDFIYLDAERVRSIAAQLDVAESATGAGPTHDREVMAWAARLARASAATWSAT